MISKAFKINDNRVIGNGDSRANKIVLNSSQNNKSKKSMYMPNIKATKKPIFLTFNTKKTFNYLQLAFIKALIFQYSNLESYIQIKTNRLSYAISRILS